jgi:hypothetical protein
MNKLKKKRNINSNYSNTNNNSKIKKIFMKTNFMGILLIKNKQMVIIKLIKEKILLHKAILN